VVSHAGTVLLVELADRIGLTAALSAATDSLRERRAGHDPGRVLVDVAVAIADGAVSISDVQVLADQQGLHGPAGSVASTPTIWRVLAGRRLGTGPGWPAVSSPAPSCPGPAPPARASPRSWSATLVSRPILIRADGAGYSHALIAALSAQGLEFSVGYPVTEAVRTAIEPAPAWAWQAASDADGDLREHADVVEVTGLLDLSKWTTDCPGMRVIVRRELPHPGATLDAFEIRDGYRYQACTTNTRSGQLAFLEARHRAHARVEDRIRTGKDTGLGHLPSRHQNINEVWVELALIAADLLALAQSMLLTTEPELQRAEPKTLRYRLLHTAARITRGQSKVFLRLAQHWPWALALAKAFTRLRQIPLPAWQPAPPPRTAHQEHGDTGPSAGDRRCLDIAADAFKIIRPRQALYWNAGASVLRR